MLLYYCETTKFKGQILYNFITSCWLFMGRSKIISVILFLIFCSTTLSFYNCIDSFWQAFDRQIDN